MIIMMINFTRSLEKSIYKFPKIITKFSEQLFSETSLTLFFPMFPFDPLKTLENLWFSDVLRGTKKGNWEEKGKLNVFMQ